MTSINFALGRQLFFAGRSRDAPTLERFAAEASVLIDAVLGTAGGAHMDGAFDKVFCRIHLPEFPLRLLPPYQGLDDSAFAKFTAEVQRRLPHWLPAS